MVIVPMIDGPSLVLFLSKPMPSHILNEAIAEAMHRLEHIFRTDKLLQEVSEVIPMPDWVQQAVEPAASEAPEWNISEPQVEPLEAKTFWDDAVLQAGGFLSPGKLTFDEAEKLGLAPEASPSDPYRVIG
jgi:hypothetical protein